MMSLVTNFAKNQVVGFFKKKLVRYAIIALVIAAASLYGYHKVKIAVQDAMIAQLREVQQKLEGELLKAIVANSSLKDQIDTLKIQGDKVMDMMNRLQNADAEVSKWFNAEQGNLLSNMPALAQPQANPQNTVDVINKDLRCALETFGKFSKCKDSTLPGATK